MMSTVIIISYFGKFRPSFSLFLESVRRNPNIDWLIFSDDILENVPENVRLYKSSLEEIEVLVQEKIDKRIKIGNPYKLCDYKPAYGLIFEDYIKDYDVWGYGDCDLIYGDLLSFIGNLFDEYDRLNLMGHLSLLKNNEFCKRAFIGEDIENVIRIFENGETCYGFDEIVYNRICADSGMKIYDGRFAADINGFYKNMRLVDRKTYKMILGHASKQLDVKNYKKQIFLVDGGRVCRAYIDGLGGVKREEFGYIHFRMEMPILIDDISKDSYIVSREGIFCLDGEIEDPLYFERIWEKYFNESGWVIDQCRFIYNSLVYKFRQFRTRRIYH